MEKMPGIIQEKWHWRVAGAYNTEEGCKIGSYGSDDECTDAN